MKNFLRPAQVCQRTHSLGGKIVSNKRYPAEVFSEWIRRYGDKAYNFAYRLSGNEQDACDLVQEAFTRAFEHMDHYDPSRPFEAWLIRILHNIYLDGVRRYERSHVVSLDAPSQVEEAAWEEILPKSEPGIIDRLIQQETEGLVQAALNSLPVAYRTVIALCDIEGFSYEQISRVMSCPVGTVRSRIHQGRLLMRKAFEEFRKKGVKPK